MRAYLNGTKNQFVTDGGTSNSYTTDWSDKGFLQSAFTTDAQSLIETTTVDNSATSTTDSSGKMKQETSYACDDTSDKIFLLSEQKVTTTDYGFDSYDSSDNARIRVTTDFSRANYAYQYTTDGYDNWWLRSPSFRSDASAGYVNYYSKADSFTYTNVNNNGEGIVPALCVSSEALPTSE